MWGGGGDICFEQVSLGPAPKETVCFVTFEEHGRQRGGGGFLSLGHKMGEFYEWDSWAVGGEEIGPDRGMQRGGLCCLFPHAVCGEA